MAIYPDQRIHPFVLRAGEVYVDKLKFGFDNSKKQINNVTGDTIRVSGTEIKGRSFPTTAILSIIAPGDGEKTLRHSMGTYQVDDYFLSNENVSETDSQEGTYDVIYSKSWIFGQDIREVYYLGSKVIDLLYTNKPKTSSN